MQPPASATSLLRRLARAGVADGDPEPVRARKATVTVVACLVTALSTVWVLTYLALGLPVSASIPLAYQVASLGGLALLAWSKDDRAFRLGQAAMMTLFPFLLQWSLGGYVASSAVSLWAVCAALGTLFFFGSGASVPWFAAFLGLSVASGLLEGTLAASPAPISEGLRTAFFVLNIAGVSVAMYVMLQYAVRARDDAFARSEGLLLNVLPGSIAARLKSSPGVIADSHDEVTVLFADVVDFTPFTERTAAADVVGVLDRIFSEFDDLAARHGVEKIKTIGDAYMVAAGLPEPRPDHAEAMAEMALEMRDTFAATCAPLAVDLQLRIGLESGPVIAGVIGRRKFIYDLWGDTVNTASRMESHGVAGRIQAGEAAHARLRERYAFEARGEIELKGKGRRPAYFLVGRLEDRPLA